MKEALKESKLDSLLFTFSYFNYTEISEYSVQYGFSLKAIVDSNKGF